MKSCFFSKNYLRSLANCLTPVIQIQAYLRSTLLWIWLYSLTLSQYCFPKNKVLISTWTHHICLWGMYYVFTQNWLFKICEEFSKVYLSTSFYRWGTEWHKNCWQMMPLSNFSCDGLNITKGRLWKCCLRLMCPWVCFLNFMSIYLWVTEALKRGSHGLKWWFGQGSDDCGKITMILPKYPNSHFTIVVMRSCCLLPYNYSENNISTIKIHLSCISLCSQKTSWE